MWKMRDTIDATCSVVCCEISRSVCNLVATDACMRVLYMRWVYERAPSYWMIGTRHTLLILVMPTCFCVMCFCCGFALVCKCAHHKGSVAMSRCRSALLDYNNMCIGMEDGILDDSSTGCHVRIRRSSNVLGEDLLHWQAIVHDLRNL